MCVSNKILNEMIISTHPGTKIWLYVINSFSISVLSSSLKAHMLEAGLNAFLTILWRKGRMTFITEVPLVSLNIIEGFSTYCLADV